MVSPKFEQEFEQLIKSIETYKAGINEPITKIICENKGLTNADVLPLMAAINNNPEVVRTLTHLSLANVAHIFNSDANQISCVLDLTRLKYLQVLKLSNNKLERAPNLSGCQELVQLHLDGNQLRVFPNITNCTKLQALNLRRNRIKQMLPWLKCPNLSQLYLGFNAFTSPPNILINPKLQVLELQGNKLSKAGEAALYALMCMKKPKFNLIYDKKCKGHLTRDSLFEHFSGISDFKDLLPKATLRNKWDGLDILAFKLFEDFPDSKQPLAAKPPSPIIKYFRNFIVPTLLPLPEYPSRIISEFLLPRATLSKRDQLDLIAFKSIFKYWKSRDNYNPLEEIAKFESELEQLSEIEKRLQEGAKACEVGKNLIELNNFIHDNKFNSQCLLLENAQGQTPLALAVAQNNERVRNRILSMLPAEEELKTRLQFFSVTLDTHEPKIISAAVGITGDRGLLKNIAKELGSCATNASLEAKHGMTIDKNIDSLGFDSFVESLISSISGTSMTPYDEDSIVYKKALTLKPRQIIERDESYYEGAVAADGSCLFYSVAFVYLLPIAHNMELFRQRFISLFGIDAVDAAEENRQYFIRNGSREVIQNPEVLQILVNHNFRKRVVNFMREHEERFQRFMPENEDFAERMQKMENPNLKEWGDQPEIAAISEMLQVKVSVYQKQGDILIPVPGAEHKVEGSDTAISLLYTQAMADSATSNPNNHYNYLLCEQDLPTNKTTLQKEEVAPSSISKDEIQQNIIGLEKTTGHENAAFNKKETKAASINNIIISPPNLTVNVGNVVDIFSSNSSAASISTTKKDNTNKYPTTGPSTISSHSGIFYSLPSFKVTRPNIGSVAKTARNMLHGFNAKQVITKGFTQVVNVGIAGLVDSVQQLARPRCSLDGTMRM